MEEKKINREWVKTAAIIFLAVLLVLTFFSNTIMNRTLPEVASAEVTDGPITAKIRGTGTVSSVGQTEVKANATQSVATVKAREGAEVKAGDVLFVMGEAGEELEDALEMLDNARFDLQAAYANYSDNYNSSGNTRAEALKVAANTAYDNYIIAKNAYDTGKVDPQQIEAAKSAWDTALADVVDETTKQDQIVSEKQTEYDRAQQDYQNNPEDEELKRLYDEATTALKLAKSARIEAIAAKEALATEAEEKYYDLLSHGEKALKEVMDAAYADYLNADAEYLAAVDAVDSAQASTNKANASNAATIARLQNQVKKYEQKVAELSGGEDYAIKAPIGGTICALSVSPGEKVSKDQVMCIIEVPDLGYQMSFSVTNDQVKRIKVGDPATVSSFFWGSTIEAEVSSIKVDPKDPQSKKLITCTLDGDVEPGSEISVSIGNKSANYDVIVPNSAVRTDSNGSFVLMITSKNSPLGNRYFAERVPVEVLASDDTNSALNANLGYGDFVITTSSSPIKNGDQVRMADNG